MSSDTADLAKVFAGGMAIGLSIANAGLNAAQGPGARRRPPPAHIFVVGGIVDRAVKRLRGRRA